MLRIASYVVAGFFMYMVALLAFSSVPNIPLPAKLTIMGGFSLPAAVALAVGLLSRNTSRRWRDTGIVLLSSGGLTLFIVGTFACYLQQEEFRKMMRPETIKMFSSYGMGFGFLALMLLAGALSLWLGRGAPDAG